MTKTVTPFHFDRIYSLSFTLVLMGLLSLCLSPALQAQNNDCSGAEVICDGTNIDYTPSGPGANDFADPDNNSGCLVSQENQSAWYYFEFAPDMPPNSTIEFDIEPYGGMGEDYDFAVFGPGVDCGNLGAPIRCSYAASNCAFCPNTGLGNGTSDVTEGPNGDGYVSALTVQPGEGYYLLVDNYNNSSNGFSLSWGGSGVPFLDCNAEPPCSGLGITVAPADFEFCDEDAPFLLGVEISGGPPDMAYGWSGTYELNLSDTNSLTPILTPPGGFTGLMNFDLTVTGGNNCIEVYPITVTIHPNPVAEAGDPQVIDCNNPIITLSSNGSTSGPSIAYDWTLNGSPAGSGASLDVDEEGLYTLTVTDQATGCTATDDVLITDNSIPPVAAGDAFGEITCYNPEAVMGVLDQSNPNATYEWFDGTILLGNGTEQVVDAPGVYTLVVTDQSNGCTASTPITVNENTIPPYANPESTNNIDCINPVTAIIATNPIPFNSDFQWYLSGGNVGTGQIITVSEPGTYTMVMTDLINGCTYEDTVIVIESPSDITVAPTVSGELTCDQASAVLDAGGSSSGSNITYSWQNDTGAEISSNSSVTVFEPGNYTLVVADNSNGCTNDSTVIVIQDLSAPQSSATALDSITCSNSIATLQGSSSPNTDVSLSWIDEDGNEISNTSEAQASMPGNYWFITTSNETGCPDSTLVQLIENTTLPTANAGIEDTITCDQPSLLLDGGGSTGSGPLNYSWENENGNVLGGESTLPTDSAGTYTLMVTDISNGCTDSDEVIIELDITPPIASAGQDTMVTCAIPSITLSGSGSGSPDLIFNWSDSTGNILSDSTNLITDQPGTFTFSVTNPENGCQASDTVEVSQDDNLPTAIAGTDDTLTCGIIQITLDASASSGNGPIVFDWQNSSSTTISDSTTAEVSSPDTYTLVVTDTENGCTDTDDILISQDITPPSADAGTDAVITCTTGTVQLDGSNSSSGPDISYEWLDEDGQQVGTTALVSLSEVGDFTLIVTDLSNSCSTTDTATVIPDSDTPVAEANSSDILSCVVLNVTLDAAGSTTGPTMVNTWLDENNNSLGNGNSVSVTDPGLYSLIVANTANGCADTTEVVVEQDILLPVADPGIFLDSLSCYEPALILNGSNSSGGSDLSLLWTDSGGNAISTADTALIDTPGNYSLQVTNNQNGCADTAAISIFDDTALPLADAGSDGILTCTDPSYLLDGSNSSTGPDISYEWYNSNDELIGTAPQASVIIAGPYTLIVTDTGNGCSSQDEITIIPDSNLPTAIASVSDTLSCAINAVTLDANGSTTGGSIIYNWQDGAGNSLSGNMATDVSLPGMYALVVTDNSNGCSATAFINVQQDTISPIATTSFENDTVTCAEPQLLLSGTGTSNSGQIEIDWSDTAGNPLGNTDSITVNSSGSYTFLITDPVNGCTASATIDIAEDNLPPVAEAGPDEELSCIITEITLDGSNSDSGPDIQYIWENEAQDTISNDITAQITEPGVYSIILTNTHNGCQSQDQLTITQDTLSPNVDAGLTATLTCDLVDYTIGSSNTSSGPEFIYQWTDGSGNMVGTDSMITIDTPDEYTLLVTNSLNGCTQTDAVTIDQNITPPNADAGSNKTITCTNPAFSLGGPNTSTGMSFQYEWTNAEGEMLGTNINLGIDTSGTYTLLVTDTDNGCTDTDEVVVAENNSLPTAIASTNGILTCTVNSISLNGTASISGSGGPLQFNWQNPDGQSFSTSSAALTSLPGAYILTTTDPSNGCVDSDTIEVLQDITPPVANAGNADELTCDEPSLTLDGGASQGSQLQYAWFTSSGIPLGGQAQVPVTQPDTYTLIVTETGNGCIDSSQVIITQDNDLPTVSVVNSGTINCYTPSSELSGQGSSSGASFLYIWTNTMGDTISNSLTTMVNEPGLFTLSVLNTGNGCENAASTTVPIDTISPQVEAGTADLLTCFNPSSTLDGSGTQINGTASWLWEDSGGNPISSEVSTTVDMPGSYMLIVTNLDNGCSSSDEVLVDQDIDEPIPVIMPNHPLITCDFPSLLLDGSGSSPAGLLQFEWVYNGDPLGNNENLSIAEPGTYSLMITNTFNGCTNSTDIEIEENTEIPQVIIAEPNIINCLIETAQLDGTASSSGPEFEYIWSGPQILSGFTAPLAEAGAAGLYELLVTNTENGCTNTASVDVLADQEFPAASASAPDAIDCFNSEVNISGVGSSVGGAFTYQWTTSNGEIISGADALNPLVGAGGEYELLVTNTENGCTATASTSVEANNTPPTAALVDAIDPACFGDANGQISVQEVQGGTPPYLFSLNGGPFSPGLPQYSSLPAGEYEILIQDINGCEWSNTYQLIEPEELLADLGSELYIELGTVVEIELEVNRTDDQLAEVIWDFPKDKICLDTVLQDCRIVVDTPLSNTIYRVNVVDERGCVTQTEVLVRVNKTRPIFVPNAFSPDGDGANDQLMVYGGRNVVSIKQFIILDRWGEVVFEQQNFQPNDPRHAWDGTFKGSRLDPGVFVYLVEAEFLDGKVEIFKGDISLIR
jgi:gliding motility-associated-like protein